VAEWIDWILHIQEHLEEFARGQGTFVYGLLFGIIFCETGLVFMPLLPGDSLLFAAGAIAANPNFDLNVYLMWGLLTVAAILGDTVNYHLGYFFGAKMPFLNPKHIARTQAFYDRYGGKTIVLARFVPIVRTFAPFVAGIGKMNYSQFLLYNAVGGFAWVTLCLFAGYVFGNYKPVKENFELVVVGIVFVSVLPMVYELVRGWYLHRKAGKNLS
jgi:membrane-associated protein